MGEGTKLNMNVYPHAAMAVFIALWGTAGSAFGGVMRKSMSYWLYG